MENVREALDQGEASLARQSPIASHEERENTRWVTEFQVFRFRSCPVTPVFLSREYFPSEVSRFGTHRLRVKPTSRSDIFDAPRSSPPAGLTCVRVRRGHESGPWQRKHRIYASGCDAVGAQGHMTVQEGNARLKSRTPSRVTRWAVHKRVLHETEAASTDANSLTPCAQRRFSRCQFRLSATSTAEHIRHRVGLAQTGVNSPLALACRNALS